MKKQVISIAIILLVFSGCAFAQSTTSSTNPKQSAADANSQGKNSGQASRDGGTNQSDNGKGKTAKTPGQAANTGGAATPANDAKAKTGTNPGAGSQSAVGQGGSKANAGKSAGTAVVSQGAINKTEPDTKMKKGSGSAPKNTKNQTGKTGNYQNEATKKSGTN